MRRIGRALKLITAPSLDLLQPWSMAMRVWPSDLNLGMHVDNVRYLQLMSMARNEFFLRSGMRWLMLRRGLGLPLAACEMRYRRPLFAWQAFSLHTQMAGWDDRRFYLTQRFERAGETMAEGVFRCAFTRGSTVLDPGAVFAELAGGAVVSPELPREQTAGGTKEAAPAASVDHGARRQA